MKTARNYSIIGASGTSERSTKRLASPHGEAAFRVFSAALKYLEDNGKRDWIMLDRRHQGAVCTIMTFILCLAVEPTEAPELFMSMAHTPECDRAQRALSSAALDRKVPLPPLDPRAVAAVALRSLAVLGPQQLLTAEEAIILLSPFLNNGNDLVRASAAAHLIQRLPATRRATLQRLLRYLKRLAVSSETCSAPGLAQAVGPALLRPERLPLKSPPEGLTNATVQCAALLIQ